ncbi:hypothetical protein M9458_018620, partial [Cirrhinus mrigala]
VTPQPFKDASFVTVTLDDTVPKGIPVLRIAELLQFLNALTRVSDSHQPAEMVQRAQ